MINQDHLAKVVFARFLYWNYFSLYSLETSHKVEPTFKGEKEWNPPPKAGNDHISYLKFFGRKVCLFSHTICSISIYISVNAWIFVILWVITQYYVVYSVIQIVAVTTGSFCRLLLWPLTCHLPFLSWSISFAYFSLKRNKKTCLWKKRKLHSILMPFVSPKQLKEWTHFLLFHDFINEIAITIKCWGV